MFFLLYINEISDDAICKSIIYPDDNTLYSKWNQASDLRQQLHLTSESKSGLQDTIDWGRKVLVYFRNFTWQPE